MRAWLVIVPLAALLLPAAVAQVPPAGHVLYCSRDCLPAQVNDADLHNVPVNVILYAHVFDALQRAPLNVVPPDPGRERDVNAGFNTPTLRVMENVVYFESNTFTMYLMPGFVDYAANGNNPDGPLSYALKLAPEGARLYWYMSPALVPSTNSTSTPVGVAGAMPQVTVAARIETGRHSFHGTLIAEGKTTAPVMVALPGGDYAYEFQVPLDLKAPEIPSSAGFVVTVNWYQVSQGDGQVAQSDWRLRSGPRFAPRLILPVENPMELNTTESALRLGTHYLVTGISPVLGNYDIDPFNLNMTFADGPMKLGDPRPVFYLANPHQSQIVRIVWAVPGDGTKFRAGDYTFALSAMNLQHTYQMRANVTLSVTGYESERRTPGPGAAASLVGVAAAMILTIRRRV